MEKIKVFLVGLYGAQNPDRAWNIVFTILLLMALKKDSRRFGLISFAVLFFAKFIWGWLSQIYTQFTPASG